MATLSEVKLIVSRLESVYKSTLEPAALQVYVQELAKFDRVRLHNAATEWIQNEKWMPKIAELIGVLKRQNPANELASAYPQRLPQDPADRELIWRMCVRNIDDPFLLTVKDMEDCGAITKG